MIFIHQSLIMIHHRYLRIFLLISFKVSYFESMVKNRIYFINYIVQLFYVKFKKIGRSG